MINILIVDDDEHILELLSHYLQVEGYVVFEAFDGEQASSILARKQVHLAVVDVMMPNKDGFQLCKEIRKYYDFPVILLTAKDQLPDKEKGFSAGTVTGRRILYGKRTSAYPWLHKQGCWKTYY